MRMECCVFILSSEWSTTCHKNPTRPTSHLSCKFFRTEVGEPMVGGFVARPQLWLLATAPLASIPSWPLKEQAHSQPGLWGSPAMQNQEWTEMSLGCRKNIKGIMLKALGSDPEEKKSLHISMRNYSSAEQSPTGLSGLINLYFI